MTKFNKEAFEFGGEYLSYNGMFVARFKRNKGDRAGFVSFLIKNFAVEEYFSEYDAGGTPVGILESRGYVSATVKRLLKSVGFAPTAEGKRKYLDEQVAKYVTA